MGIFGKIFTWWDGATIGTSLNSGMTGVKVGSDAQGNEYFRAKKPYPKGHPFAGKERRWVIYNGPNDASRVPAEWHGWLHGSYGKWRARIEPAAAADLGGGVHAQRHRHGAAYRPAGATGQRAAATGDYEAWSPEGDNPAASPDA